MGSEYKRIILLKGLELINDYQFSIVKSLLAHDLGLTTNMQEEYNKVKIADLMEKKFPGAACVDKLIDLFKDMPPLKDIVKQLRNEKMKVAKKMKTTEETPKKKPQQARVGPSACAPTTSSALLCGRAEGTTASQKRKTAATGTAATKKNKGIQPQTPAVCRPGASTAAALASLPRPQTASSAPLFSAFPEVPLPRHPCRVPSRPGTAAAVGGRRRSALGQRASLAGVRWPREEKPQPQQGRRWSPCGPPGQTRPRCLWPAGGIGLAPRPSTSGTPTPIPARHAAWSPLLAGFGRCSDRPGRGQRGD
nr:myeloid cell nuclear differentiation antigen-like [Mirounga angustirostris]